MAQDDADHDGLLNWQEDVAGADPTNPASCLGIAAISMKTGPAPAAFYNPTRDLNSGTPRMPGRKRNSAPAPGPLAALSLPPAVVT